MQGGRREAGLWGRSKGRIDDTLWVAHAHISGYPSELSDFRGAKRGRNRGRNAPFPGRSGRVREKPALAWGRPAGGRRLAGPATGGLVPGAWIGQDQFILREGSDRCDSQCLPQAIEDIPPVEGEKLYYEQIHGPTLVA